MEGSVGSVWRIAPLSVHFRLHPVHYCADVAKAAATLWVPYVAGALSGLDTGRDRSDHGASASKRQLGLDTAGRVSKAVAHEDIIVGRALLVDALSEIVFG